MNETDGNDRKPKGLVFDTLKFRTYSFKQTQSCLEAESIQIPSHSLASVFFTRLTKRLLFRERRNFHSIYISFAASLIT